MANMTLMPKQTSKPKGTKNETVVVGRDSTNNRTALLDPRNGLYKYKPYKPDNTDIKHREYKYKPYKPEYKDPLRRKIDPFPYRPYVSEVGYKSYFDYQLPKKDHLSFKNEEELEKSSKPPKAKDGNNNAELKGFGYPPLFARKSVFQYHRFQPPLDW
ncbi:hypothetical protein CHS0354_004900 [Potamilus streckersoni]|uniref:Uncharacterized protein n=1 Tax=Potamilus streckersoni TaxID=2493646 RepID=A0AAE0TIX9_9BIVA|nr:hypothetical protein CHS0354_004900 [Potamilus streckersoni]